jgi:hypothetical protein
MYVVRDVSDCKPGKAKDLVDKLQVAAPHPHQLGTGNVRILTDTAVGQGNGRIACEARPRWAVGMALTRRASRAPQSQRLGGWVGGWVGGW